MTESIDQVDDSSQKPEEEIGKGSQNDNALDANDDSSLESSVAKSGANMGLIMDIPVTVSMELGRTRLSIRELLSMNPGSVIELQRLATEPMEILVNGTLVAHGEAVRVGERYGVKLTSVVTAGERLEKISGL